MDSLHNNSFSEHQQKTGMTHHHECQLRIGGSLVDERDNVHDSRMVVCVCVCLRVWEFKKPIAFIVTIQHPWAYQESASIPGLDSTPSSGHAPGHSWPDLWIAALWNA